MLSRFSQVRLFEILWTLAHQALLSMDSPGKNTGVGCHALLQGIFLTQRWNSHLLQLLHCRRILYHWVKTDHVYMKPTLIMKTHNFWKAKMEKPKQAFIFYQLIIRKKPFISIFLPLFFQLTFHWRIIAFQNFVFKNLFPEICFPESLFSVKLQHNSLS